MKIFVDFYFIVNQNEFNSYIFRNNNIVLKIPSIYRNTPDKYLQIFLVLHVARPISMVETFR